jgi:hypothetical protein
MVNHHSHSEASIAFSSKVFFTTSNLIPALKQALLKLEVVSASNPEMSANINYIRTSANCAVKSSIAIDFSSLVILKFLTTNYTALGSKAIAGLIVLDK